MVSDVTTFHTLLQLHDNCIVRNSDFMRTEPVCFHIMYRVNKTYITAPMSPGCTYRHTVNKVERWRFRRLPSQCIPYHYCYAESPRIVKECLPNTHAMRHASRETCPSEIIDKNGYLPYRFHLRHPCLAVLFLLDFALSHFLFFSLPL